MLVLDGRRSRQGRRKSRARFICDGLLLLQEGRKNYRVGALSWVRVSLGRGKRVCGSVSGWTDKWAACAVGVDRWRPALACFMFSGHSAASLGGPKQGTRRGEPSCSGFGRKIWPIAAGQPIGRTARAPILRYGNKPETCKACEELIKFGCRSALSLMTPVNPKNRNIPWHVASAANRKCSESR